MPKKNIKATTSKKDSASTRAKARSGNFFEDLIKYDRRVVKWMKESEKTKIVVGRRLIPTES